MVKETGGQAAGGAVAGCRGGGLCWEREREGGDEGGNVVVDDRAGQARCRWFVMGLCGVCVSLWWGQSRCFVVESESLSKSLCSVASALARSASPAVSKLESFHNFSLHFTFAISFLGKHGHGSGTMSHCIIVQFLLQGGRRRRRDSANTGRHVL